jgi:deoxyadenosine/deoxycytidine kinase
MLKNAQVGIIVARETPIGSSLDVIQAPPEQKKEETLFVVALEGNIGSGKSTLSQKAKNADQSVEVYQEQTNEMFLSLFYGDPKKYAFSMQWGMLKTRIYQLNLAQRDLAHRQDKGPEVFVWDRSMIGDYVFAIWNHLTGSISEKEMEVYESEFGGSLNDLKNAKFLKYIQVFALLYDEPASCKRKLEIVRGNKSEQGIPIEYYEGIDDVHFALFLELLQIDEVKVTILNWGEYEDAREVLDYIKEVNQASVNLPKVMKVNTERGFDLMYSHYCSTQADSVSVFSCEEDVLSYCRSIPPASPSLKGRNKGLAQRPVAFISSEIMQISSIQKGVKTNSRYAIPFYKNEYKKAVLHLLSRGAHVIFYRSH